MKPLRAEPLPGQASGSALAGGVVGALLVLAGFSWMEGASEAFHGVDSAVLRFVVAHRTGWISSTARVITDTGTSPLLYPLVALAGLSVRLRTGRWAPGVAALVVVVAGVLSRLGLSRLVRDGRPPSGDWLVQVHGFSFPSGHATTSTLTAGALGWLLAQAVESGWVRRAGFLVLASWALLVSLSRVYLGVHWITDIVGSWLLAAAWLAGLLATSRHFRRPSSGDGAPHRAQQQRTPGLRSRS